MMNIVRRFPRPFLRARGTFALATASAIVLSVTGCGGEAQRSVAPPFGPASPTAVTNSTAPDPSSPEPPRGASAPTASEGTPIRVTIGQTVLTGRLSNNATARDLIAQLPLTLTFSDLNRLEKIAHLPRGLSMDGVPRGDDPQPRDIGYYAPWGNLVFYYGDVGYWDGIVRIGRFDGNMDVIQGQTGDFTATIELAH